MEAQLPIQRTRVRMVSVTTGCLCIAVLLCEGSHDSAICRQNTVSGCIDTRSMELENQVENVLYV